MTNPWPLAAAMVVAFISAAHAQESSPDPLPRSLQQEEAPSKPEEGGPGVPLMAGAHVRWSVPFGHAGHKVSGASTGGGTVIEFARSMRWSDLFSHGWGWDLEVDVILGRQRDRGNSLRYALYVAMLEDHYSGDRVTDDETGAQLKAGDMSISSVLTGIKGVSNLGQKYFVGGRVGVGAVHYSEVTGVFTAPGATAFTQLLFEDTWNLAFEVRAHGGTKFGSVRLTAGLGCRVLGPPSEGKTVDLKSGMLMTFDAEVGAELGF